MDSPLGSSLRRKEDHRLITGRGRYVEDLHFPGMLHTAFVRSPYAHARVRDAGPDKVAGLSAARGGDPAAGFAGADVVVEARLGIGRVHGVPIETRGIVVTPAGPDGRLTLWTSSQSPYGLRSCIAGAFGLAEEQVRVVVVDTGGGFGIKGHAYSEDLIVTAAARRLDRPVKWAESRPEHFLTASPDRGQRHAARLGLPREGRSAAR